MHVISECFSCGSPAWWSRGRFVGWMVGLGAGGCVILKLLAALHELMKLCVASPLGHLGWLGFVFARFSEWNKGQDIFFWMAFSWAEQSGFFFPQGLDVFCYISSCPAYKNIHNYCWVALHLPYGVRLAFVSIFCARASFQRQMRSPAPTPSPRFVSSYEVMACSWSAAANPMRQEDLP